MPKVNDKFEHGYMYIGHLPHGFFEDEIKSYFSQFGKVVRVRVARSAKTGNYRGYGFIEFVDKEVARIAAETMNNYLMFNKVIKCQVIPKEKIHPDTFRNAGKLFVSPVKSWLRKSFNRKRSDGQIKKLKEKQDTRMKERLEKLKSLGISLDLTKLSTKLGELDAPVKKATKKETKETKVVETPAVVKQKAPEVKVAKKPVKSEPEKKPAVKETKKQPQKAQAESKTVQKQQPVKNTPEKGTKKNTPAPVDTKRKNDSQAQAKNTKKTKK